MTTFDRKTKIAAIATMSVIRKQKRYDMLVEGGHDDNFVENYSHEYSIRGVCREFGCTREELLGWCKPCGIEAQ